MDPISRVFYRIFTLIIRNPMYPNALELQNWSWITYDRRIQLIDKPNDKPNYRVKFNWSTSAPMEGFFNDKELELSKTVPKIKAFEKNDNRKRSFPGDKDNYMSMRL